MSTETAEVPRIALPNFDLAEGEQHLFSVVRPDGRTVHTILLPGDSDRASHQAQLAWAQEVEGGDLLSPAEAQLAFAICPELFEKAIYWTNRIDEDDSAYAWCTHFGNGNQGSSHRDNKFRARRVRRLISQ